MSKYKVVVWATVGGQTAKEVLDLETDTPPTDEEINDIYIGYIGNILDSGAYLVSEGEDI